MIRHLIQKTIAAWIYYTRGGAARARFLGVKVGTNCRIAKLDFGTEPYLISIGDNVTITDGVKLVTHDGSTWLVRDHAGRRYRYGYVEIGSHVFIGMNSLVLPGVTIGDRVVVGAGSVVTKSIPSDSMVVGVPARRIGSFTDYEQKALASFLSAAELNQAADKRAVILNDAAAGRKPLK